ncbi:ABC transporter permease subunit [Mesorhizobium argentiipisi]|uniref:ABC transporter permease subunit n=1 Tax=Mesorhizobium argentiipisi TaxID=3015175 RepID=UPI0039F46EA4
MGGFTAQFATAFSVTVSLGLVSGSLGTVIGLLLAMSKSSPASRFKPAVTAYTTVVRGVPELLIILVIYFGGPPLPARSPADMWK